MSAESASGESSATATNAARLMRTSSESRTHSAVVSWRPPVMTHTAPTVLPRATWEGWRGERTDGHTGECRMYTDVHALNTDGSTGGCSPPRPSHPHAHALSIPGGHRKVLSARFSPQVAECAVQPSRCCVHGSALK
eukprot:185801-Chlamydomonas_euryale.AAC.1